MVREHKKMSALTKAIIIGVILVVLVVIYLFFIGSRIGPYDAQSPQADPFTRRSNLPSLVQHDSLDTQNYTYTSYRLGLRFHYRNLYQTRVNQSACPDNWPKCPVITNTVNVKSPVEDGNTINFLDYHLEVFDKDEGESLPNAMTRLMFPFAPQGACVVNDYPVTADKIEKATIEHKALPGGTDDGTCPTRYRGNENGRHFFMYPKYPFVFFYVEGPTGTPALFSHQGTWLSTIELAVPEKH